MEVLGQFNVEKMFDSIIVEDAYSCDYTTIYHFDCGHTFGGKWKRNYHSSAGYTTGAKYYVCPKCGKRSNPYLHKVILHHKWSKVTPINLCIEVLEYKDYLDLRIAYDGISLHMDGTKNDKWRCKETLRFDFKRKIALFKDNRKEWHELTIDYIRGDYDMMPILGFIGDSYAVSDRNRRRLHNVFKALRIAFERRVKRAYGFSVKDVYISPSTSEYMGFASGMLINMILKLSAPDMPNIKQLVGNQLAYLDRYCDRTRLFNVPFSERVLDFTRTGMSFNEALRITYNAPQSRALRRAMVRNPFIVKLTDLLNLLRDENNRRNLLTKAFSMEDEHQGYLLRIVKSCVKLELKNKLIRGMWQRIINRFGEPAFVSFVLNQEYNSLNDIITMYRDLSKDNRAKLWRQKFKLKDFHDIVTSLYNTQEYGGISLPIILKLQTDVNGMHFLVPRTAADLMEVGRKLNNCVGSYRNRVINGETAIVVVTDDHMKPIACLELSKNEGKDAFNRLVQARLFANKAVAQNKEVNTAVLAWADQLKIEPATIDVEAQVS